MKKLLSQVFFAFVAILLCSMVFGFVAKRFLDITVVTVDRALGFAVLCSVVVFAVQLFYYHREDNIPDVDEDPAKKLLAREYAQRMTSLPMPDTARLVRMPSHLLAPHVVNLAYYLWEQDGELVLFPRWKDIEDHLYLLQEDQKRDVEYYQVLLQPLHIPVSAVQYIAPGNAHTEQGERFTMLRYENALAETVELLFTEDSFDELRRALPSAELQTGPAVSFREERIKAKKRMPVAQDIPPTLDLTEIVSAIQKLKEANLITPSQKPKAPAPAEPQERIEEAPVPESVVGEEIPHHVAVEGEAVEAPDPPAEVAQEQTDSQAEQDKPIPVSQDVPILDQAIAVEHNEEPKALPSEPEQEPAAGKEEEEPHIAAVWGEDLWANRQTGTAREYSDSDSPDIAAAWRHLKPKPDKTITPFPKKQEANSDIASTWWKLTQPVNEDTPSGAQTKRPRRPTAMPEGAGEIASWNTPEARPEPRRPESKPGRRTPEPPVRPRQAVPKEQWPDTVVERQRPASAAVGNQPGASQRRPKPAAAKRPAERPKEYIPQEHRNRLRADWELMDITSQIQQLKEQWAQSLIDEQEYETQKIRLMNMM